MVVDSSNPARSPKELFDRHAAAIRDLSAAQLTIKSRWNFSINDEWVVSRENHGEEKGPLTVCYTPFDWINEQAAVVLIGVTPGHQQMVHGLRAAQIAMQAGLGWEAVCKRTKHSGAFAGPMRTRLGQWLDELAVHEHLGIDSSARLFDTHAHLLHSTSLIRYPVFTTEGGNDYNGRKPPVDDSEMCWSYIDWFRTNELPSLSKTALIIPLGAVVSPIVEGFCATGLIETDQTLLDFTHPSGAYAQGPAVFRERAPEFKEQAAAWFAKHPGSGSRAVL